MSMVTHLSMKMVPLIEKNLRIRMNLKDGKTVAKLRIRNRKLGDERGTASWCELALYKTLQGSAKEHIIGCVIPLAAL